jgi:uroporphyrin-III C-methyltransferase/precorrin-2 dehydrogenase/sirohydrochlorin ferrochelatase
MGLVSIDIICSKLIKHGLESKTPCAIVQQGTTPNQKVFVSNLGEMPQLAKKEKPIAPTIFIIGYVVNLREKLNWFNSNQ